MKAPTHAPAMVALYPALAEAAKAVGYALAVHGSVGQPREGKMTDFDLVAVPWAEPAGSPDELIEAIVSASGGRVVADCARQRWDQKPHGRAACSVIVDGAFYAGRCAAVQLDVSVVPRTGERDLIARDAIDRACAALAEDRSDRACADRAFAILSPLWSVGVSGAKEAGCG